MPSLCNSNLRPKWNYFWQLWIPLVDGVKDPRRKKYCPLPRLLFLRQRPSSGVWKTGKMVQGKDALNEKKIIPCRRWRRGMLFFIHRFLRFVPILLWHHSRKLSIPHDNVSSFSRFCTSSSSSHYSTKSIWASLEISMLSSGGIEMAIAAYNSRGMLIYHLLWMDLLSVSQWTHVDALLTWILIYSYDVNWRTG